MDFYNDRRPDPRKDGYVDEPLTRQNLKAANSSIRSATPLYRADDVNRKIRTTAVQRHRGKHQFETVGEYMNFILGTDDGSE